MTPPRPRYVDLYFGYSDSGNEAKSNEDEFVRSYVDLRNATQSVVAGEKFLVLGPKGTGKSALAWYLFATESNFEHLTSVKDASSLPLADIPRIDTGQPAGPERTVTAWRFILLCNFLDLVLRDKNAQLKPKREIMRVTGLLRNFGFMGSASGRALVQTYDTTVSIPIPKLGQVYQRHSTPSLNIFNLLPYMEDWVMSATSSPRHVLMLDGLDSIFLNDSHYDESLASLVQAAYFLNQRVLGTASTGSVVLLLRNDVFSRIGLSLPDSQKMRDDQSIELDWRILSGAAGVRAPLMQLVNLKAAHALGLESVDVLSYFPTQVVVGPARRQRRFPTLQYFLNMTRHTPRDFLRLFEEIRQVVESGAFPDSDPLSQEVIREGILQYCTRYFVGAIRNEFAGFDGGPESPAAAISALQHINKQSFSRQDFDQALAATGYPDDGPRVDRLLTLLFYAGAIGNRVAGRHDSYMQFYHRRDESEIYLRGTFELHNALIHGWGMRRTT